MKAKNNPQPTRNCQPSVAGTAEQRCVIQGPIALLPERNAFIEKKGNFSKIWKQKTPKKD